MALALGELRSAKAAFTAARVVVDFTALQQALFTAAALLDDAETGAGHGQHAQAAIDTFAAAIAAAHTAAAAPGVTQTGVAGATAALRNAQAAFEAARVVVDFTALENTLAAASALHARAVPGEGHGQHPRAAIAALAAAIDTALTAAAAPAPTQAEITGAHTALQRAVTVFNEAVQTVDFTALNTALAAADTLLAGATAGATAAGQYPQSAIDTLAAVLGTVRAVEGKLGVTQDETDTARLMLQNAVAAFEAARLTAADVAAPRITRHPVAQTVAPGGTAGFTVAATGNNLRYQWRKDGADIAGATSDALFITYAAPADAGAYSVVVTNAFGASTSYEAPLTLASTGGGSGGGGAPSWPLLALLAALPALRRGLGKIRNQRLGS